MKLPVYIYIPDCKLFLQGNAMDHGEVKSVNQLL